MWEDIQGGGGVLLLLLGGHTCTAAAVACSKRLQPPHWSPGKVEGEGDYREEEEEEAVRLGNLWPWHPYAVCASASCADDTCSTQQQQH